MAIGIKANGAAEVIEPKETKDVVSVPANPNSSPENIPGTANKNAAQSSGVSGLTEPGTSSAPSSTPNIGTSSPAKVDTNAGTGAAGSGAKYSDLIEGLGQGYESKWDDQIADLYNQIIGRKEFSYSPDDDLLYQQYVQKYTQQGKQAMKDTMGQTAALTGGYSSSYGQAVGQQQYDAYLQELNNLLPQLQDAAFQRYAAEGDRLNQMFNLTGAMDERDMNRFNLDRSIDQATYDRLMNEAALRGAAGDFGGYEDLFGSEASGKMETTFNLEKLITYLDAGLVKKEQIQQLLNPFLESIGVSPTVAKSGSSDPWAYGGPGWNPGYMAGTSGDKQTRPDAADSSAYWSKAWDDYNS